MLMKINKKIIVSSMALCMGAALAGSVSGTIAWYQYSTRSTVAMLGTSVGVAKNLQIQVGDTVTSNGWKSDLKMADIQSYLNGSSHSKGDLIPVTTGALAKDAAIGSESDNGFYTNPVYQRFEQNKWAKATGTEYVEIPLNIRAIETGTSNSSVAAVEKYISKDIYLHDVTIRNANTNTQGNPLDISSAVRVNISGSVANANISASGEDTNTYGYLDLNNDTNPDGAEHYEWEYDSTKKPTPVYYGTENSKQVTYKMGDRTSDVTASQELYANDEEKPTSIDKGVKIATTPADNADGIKITLKIWLEGWQTLSDGTSSKTLWDVANYDLAKFNVGITFVCNA